MTAADIIAALRSSTPSEAVELAAAIAEILSKHSAPAHVEQLRQTLQVGDRFTSTRVMPGAVVGQAGGPMGAIGTHGGSGGAMG